MNTEKGIFRTWLMLAAIIAGATVLMSAGSYFDKNKFSFHFTVEEGQIFSYSSYCPKDSQRSILIEKWKQKGTEVSAFYCKAPSELNIARDSYKDYGRKMWENTYLVSETVDRYRDFRKQEAIETLTKGSGVLIAWVLLFFIVRFIVNGFMARKI